MNEKEFFILWLEGYIKGLESANVNLLYITPIMEKLQELKETKKQLLQEDKKDLYGGDFIIN